MTAQRVAFVVPRFSEQGTVGGAETLLKALAGRLAHAGRTVTVLTTCAADHFTWKNELPPGRRRIGGLDVHFFPVDEDRDVESFLRAQESISRHGAVTPEEEEIWIRNSVTSRALCRHLEDRGEDYDRIVLGPYLFGLVFAASQIHPGRSLLVPCLHDEPFAYLTIMKRLFHAVAGCMFNSEPERDLARSLFDLSDERCHVVGMGLDPFEADPSAARSRHGLRGEYLLFSGRREPLKGTPLLLDYADTFRQRTGRDLKLVFTGSGPINPPPALAEHVRDLGFVSEETKHEVMAGALAFCHPSVNESFGIVLLESWLARVPALVHAGSAVLSWQCRRSNGGLWFRAYPEFEEELLLIMDRLELRRAMGEAGRAYVLREYAWEKVEKRLLDALDRK